jgi:hypothetical protein
MSTVELEQNPAVVRRDWLPSNTPFDALNELHDEHVATLDDIRQITGEYHALLAVYQGEDDRALEAQREAYSAGTTPKLPKRTPQATRDERLRELNERGSVVQQHLRDLVTEAVATIIAHEQEWGDVLRQEERVARQRVNELRQELAEAERIAARTPDLRTWIERTARNQPGGHLHWGWLEHQRPTTDLLPIANQGVNRGNSIPSQALRHQQESGGGVATDEKGVPDYSDETMDYSSDSYLNQLDESLREHARNRRAGTTTPGGL